MSFGQTWLKKQQTYLSLCTDAASSALSTKRLGEAPARGKLYRQLVGWECLKMASIEASQKGAYQLRKPAARAFGGC